MSSTQVTESAKAICISIRIGKLKFLRKLQNNASYKINLKIGNQLWSSSSRKKVKNSLFFNELHSFDISDDSNLQIILAQDQFLLSAIHQASSTIKVTPESKKCTNWYFLYNNEEAVAKVLVGFLVDEKNEPFSKFQLLHGLELEKEEVKFFKIRYLRKLRKLKSEKNEFCNKFSNVLCLIKGSVVEKSQKSGSVNKRVNQTEVVNKQLGRAKTRIFSVGNKSRGSYQL